MTSHLHPGVRRPPLVCMLASSPLSARSHSAQCSLTLCVAASEVGRGALITVKQGTLVVNYPGSLIKAEFGCRTFIVLGDRNETVITVGIGFTGKGLVAK